MALLRAAAALGLAALLGACSGERAPAVETISHGRFQSVVLVSPASPQDPAAPQGVVMLLSGASGWDSAAQQQAGRFAARGALVIGIDEAALRQVLAGDGSDCLYAAGDLENLSRFVQAYRHLSGYQPPLLAGLGDGALLAYGALAQAPPGTFAGALSFGLCPGPAGSKAACAGSAKSLPAPWLLVTAPSEPPAACPAAQTSQLLQERPGAHRLADADWPAAVAPLLGSRTGAPAAPPAALRELPIVELPAARGAANADTWALMLSGDGGWAGLDKDVAAALGAEGIAVVGLDSLRYFWSARTPEGIAADLGRIIGYYSSAWHRPRVLLIGYSQGADVLPFAVNRLSDEARAHVALTAVLGLSPHALFEFHLSNWLGDDSSGPATLPEMNRISGMPVVCIYGTEESDSLCPQLDTHRFTLVPMQGGHHFNGDYGALARQILAAAGSPPVTAPAKPSR